MNFLYLSAANIAGVSPEQSTSYKICQIARQAAQRRYPDGVHTIVELRGRRLSPCVGCGKCWASQRCVAGDDFNDLYTQIIQSDLFLIVSPHYAPIPAKLAALLEKMEQITFLHWGADSTYRSEVYGKPTGVISHGGGSDWALESYKRMVNDTIANALDTIQLRLIPLSEQWDTGRSAGFPIRLARFSPSSNTTGRPLPGRFPSIWSACCWRCESDGKTSPRDVRGLVWLYRWLPAQQALNL